MSAPLTTLADGALVVRCVAGEPEAWEVFVDRFSRYVLAIIGRGYRLTGPDAEDVFQEVFLRAYERLGGLREPDALQPWLAQLTRRACVDRLRAGERIVLTDAEHGDGADETIAELDEALDLHRAMATMPDHCADVLDRFCARDQTYQVIAEETGLAPGTIASRISRCLARLRELLDPS